MHEKRWIDFCDFHAGPLANAAITSAATEILQHICAALIKNGASPAAFPEVFKTAHETAGEEDEGAEEKRLQINEFLASVLGSSALTQSAQDEVLIFLLI